MNKASNSQRSRVICHLMASADGRIGTPALFDVERDGVSPHRLSLRAVERRADDVLWLRYRVEPGVAGA